MDREDAGGTRSRAREAYATFDGSQSSSRKAQGVSKSTQSLISSKHLDLHSH